MLLIQLQPQQPMNTMTHIKRSFDQNVHIHCAIQLETLVRSDGIGVELLRYISQPETAFSLNYYSC